jgi:hypothetical protein
MNYVDGFPNIEPPLGFYNFLKQISCAQIKRTPKYLFFIIISGVFFIGFSVGLWAVRIQCN